MLLSVYVQIHPALGTVEYLEKLVMFGNKISFLPKQLGRLSHLTHLDLQVSKLQSLLLLTAAKSINLYPN